LDICVVIPAYNEESTIGKVIKDCLFYGKVIVVDDSSNDNTAIVSLEAGAEVVTNKNNLGYDGALLKGIKVAVNQNYKIIVTLDADGQHPVDQLSNFLDIIRKKKTQIILGSRSKYPRISEKLFNFYTKCFHDIPDILCGMKAYSSQVLIDIDIDKSLGSIGTYITLECSRKKQIISCVNIDIKKRHYGKARLDSLIKAELKILRAMIYAIYSDIKNIIFKNSSFND